MAWTQQRLAAARACVVLLVVIACLFLWTAVLSFDPLDPPSPHVYPHPDPCHNAGGLAGAYVAYKMFEYFGKGAYAAVGGLTLALLVFASRGRMPALWQRVLGVALLITVVSAAAHCLTDPSLWPEQRGGVLGFVVASWLRESVKWMTIPVLLYGFIVGMLFTGEELVMKLPALWRRHLEAAGPSRPTPAERPAGRLASMAGRLRGLLALFGRPATPALAGAASTSASAARPRPAGAKAEDAQGRAGRSATAAATAVAEDEEDEDLEDEEECDEEVEDEYDDEDDEEDDEEVEEADRASAPPAEPKVNFSIPRPAAAVPVIPPKPYPAELKAWELPPISMLAEPEYTFNARQEALVKEKARILEQALQDFRIEARVVEIDTGPVITMFELQVAAGVKVSQISSLANDIARAMRAPSVRVVSPIPGKDTVGIEVPNLDKEKVRLRELMTLAGERLNKMQLPLFLGKDASGNPLIEDLTRMPHMLIAGTTGSGKSVCINSIIVSLLMTQRPDMVKLILVDPKMVEMSMFREVPHLMCPIVTETERAEKILEWATVKMDERYALLAEAGVRNIAQYNRLTPEEKEQRFQPTTDEERAQIPSHLPYIVIIIDELADLMMMSAKEVELHLSRLAQKSRAVGIHIIVATQRPEAKIVTGLIKSNLPCRIAFRVASRMDSRIVLDQNGAEVLMGQGDMLFLPPGESKLVRSQGTFIEDSELRDVINFLKERGQPEFHPELVQLGRQNVSADGPRDELFDQAVEIVLETRRGSVSLLQRRLTIGYSRASRLMDEMAALGIVGEYKGSQAREVLITPEEWRALKEQEAARMQAEAQRIRTAVHEDGSVPDDMFDDDI